MMMDKGRNTVLLIVMVAVVFVAADDPENTTISTTLTTPSTTTAPPPTTTPTQNTTKSTTTPTTTIKTTTTLKPTPPPPIEDFIKLFYAEWSCENATDKPLTEDVIEKLIYKETLAIIQTWEGKRVFSACYTNDVSQPTYNAPKVMHLYSRPDSKGCNNSTNNTLQILTTFHNTTNYTACLLNHQDKIKTTAFVAMGVCASINADNGKPTVSNILCMETLTPAEPSGGFAAGTFFGGMILAIVLMAIVFVAFKYKCGRQGGFSQVFTVSANEYQADVDPHDPVLNLSTGRLDLITA